MTQANEVAAYQSDYHIPAERRELVSLLMDICKERRISIKTFSSEWILELESGNSITLVIGYDFSLNPAPAQQVAKDKNATSLILASKNIPSVEHNIFHGPLKPRYLCKDGNWNRLLAYFNQHGQDVVCKRNEGTGGADIYRAKYAAELEIIVHQLFSKCGSISLSPFLQIEAEYRVIVLDGQCLLLYSKERPVLRGDGITSVRELFINLLKASPDFQAALDAISSLENEPPDWNYSPSVDEAVPINWRHNLGLGAVPVPLDMADERARTICGLAVAGARALQLTVAAVDIIQVGGRLCILEVNSGIMMERFVHNAKNGKAIAKGIYQSIISRVFQHESNH